MKVCRGFQRCFREVFTDPLRDPLKGRVPSQRLSVLLPLIVLPLELSPIDSAEWSKIGLLNRGFGSILLFARMQSETGTGGVKTYRALEGGGLAPKVAPRRLGFLTPKLATFYRISVERGQYQGPSNFRIPVSNTEFTTSRPNGLQRDKYNFK